MGPDEAVVVRAAELVRKAARWAEHDSLPAEDELDKFLRTGPHETITVADDGEDPPAGRVVRATYSRPFVAHASMAPSCGIAVWRGPGRVDVWSHSQGVFPLARAIAGALGLEAEAVRVEHAENAGCYGHNAADDAAFDAVLLARAVPGTPVQVLWSRQDELAWAPFGSAMTADVAATLSPEGLLSSWEYDVYSQGHTARPGYAGVPGLLSATLLDPPAIYPAAVDPPAAAGAGSTRNALPGYDLPRRRITGHRLIESPIRSSAMRGLGAYLNVFAIESFLDEASAAAGRDPLEFRLAHLSDPRGRRVLETAAEAAGWGRPRDDGVGLGLGYARYKGRGAYCAVVAEVEAETEVRVRRLHIAVDVGLVVNPDGVRNQIEGGATQSASWTLVERVRFDRRQVTSDTWESYPILRFSQTPAIDVTVIDSAEPSLGAGEAAQGPTAAAIANAVAAAIDVRVRDLPLTTEAIIAAINRDT
ncbi:molybdopterin-dependent oxidoreductase [Actinoplanes bogorensis]|uniref:Molybdopterin-dependent oxidoreductase n=1 Tax=Paractinoplanes bogorensis TaxID=1610840 RepID=A0ABS5Z3W2_9ACTN|nr:molybdopterin cofactor-binding domain-containing protein [Actinoplanes bogorensis]MBU2670337.1 molybdopterin-dependent oxidoreductase [Actinoplanes bogorensis]